MGPPARAGNVKKKEENKWETKNGRRTQSENVLAGSGSKNEQNIFSGN